MSGETILDSIVGSSTVGKVHGTGWSDETSYAGMSRVLIVLTTRRIIFVAYQPVDGSERISHKLEAMRVSDLASFDCNHYGMVDTRFPNEHGWRIRYESMYGWQSSAEDFDRFARSVRKRMAIV